MAQLNERKMLKKTDEELDEKLIEVPEEDKKDFEDKMAAIGFEIEGKGKTLLGRDHYQFVKKFDHELERKELEATWKQLQEISDEMHANDIPMTMSMGIHRDDPKWISLGLDLDKKYVEESCEKEDNKSVEECNMLKEEITSDMKIKALADYLDIHEEDVDEFGDCEYETIDGDYYVGTEEEMDQLALDHEGALIDDMGLDLFTPYFKDQIIGDPDMFNAHWFAEYWEEYNDQADDEDKIEVSDDESAVQLFADTFGDEHLVEVIDREGLLNKEAITKEIIRLDGRESILATYDGEEIDLGNGLYAYRYN